jgi:hypothetical protein
MSATWVGVSVSVGRRRSSSSVVVVVVVGGS